MRTKSILFLLLILIMGCSQDDDNLTGLDIRLFKGPAWELAKAVRDEDTIKIKQIIAEGTISVNYQEPKFGQPLLMWAIRTNHSRSVKALLESGADPNLRDHHDGTTSLIYAAANFDTSSYVRMLLDYKANVNTVASNDSTNMLVTPLISAAYHRLESVRLLVDAGADINYTTKNHKCALSAGFTYKKVDIVRYLLIDKSADFNKSFGKTIDGKDIQITDLLRRWVFPLDSDSYKVKMEIVNYLKEKGMDYSKAPIPEHYFKNYPKEFLAMY